MVIKTKIELGEGIDDFGNIFWYTPAQRKCELSKTFIKAIILTLFGILSIIWTPFQLMMEERLRMSTALPAYYLWKNPPDEVLLKVHIFNVTNSAEFQSGVDKKMNLQEIGPIVYREKLIFKNITFNANSTLSYIAERQAIFIPEMNTINLNDTIIVPNIALLSIVTYLQNFSIFTKIAINLLINRLNTQPFVNTTIYNYMWNFSDPIVSFSHKIVPSLVPVQNIGILSRVYDDFTDSITMFMGTQQGHEKFSLIDKYDGSSEIPGYKNCKVNLTYSSEGVMYNQFLTKESKLKYWRKTICKPVDLSYTCDASKYGVSAYRYTLSPNTFNRTYPAYDDCFKGDPTTLPNGLTDVSNCYYGVPIAASFPHFLFGDKVLDEYVTGLTPNENLHESYAIVEPITGVPLEQVARSQSNVVVRNMRGFAERVQMFSDTVIPMFWLEYKQEGIPVSIRALVYLATILITPVSIISTSLFLILGAWYSYKFFRDFLRETCYNLNQQKSSYYEREIFLER